MKTIYGYIYKYTYLPKNLIYIGQKKSNKFEPNYLGSGIMWKRIIAKADKEDIKQEILQWCYSKEELDAQEKFWIKKYNSTNHSIGCNISTGGDGGNLGPQVIQKIKDTIKQNGVRKGEDNPAFNKHWYTNGIISILDYTCPEGFYPGTDININNKRNKKLSSKTRTEEQKQNYSLSKLGDKNPMKKLTGDKHPRYNKKCYTSPDGTISKYFIPGEEPIGWIQKMHYSLTTIENRCRENNPAFGKHWYNNGKVQLLCDTCPEGFIKGMLKKIKKGCDNIE